ncbi:hypothetical protein MAPG_10389 [Magnaporthiopsis poae ATCC 64411]|uniref:Uncharacterized protein n=1 Tax=Magnaporthiopsis poae (strain ATCC 64411 / 73-15) TaxID=644358 RepID=A0A0C4ECG5_MAGP6|nr:hypothetical protein MAPG_10389 [Magnaporthiopsis poae ATCC 64411]
MHSHTQTFIQYNIPPARIGGLEQVKEEDYATGEAGRNCRVCLFAPPCCRPIPTPSLIITCSDGPVNSGKRRADRRPFFFVHDELTITMQLHFPTGKSRGRLKAEKGGRLRRACSWSKGVRPQCFDFQATFCFPFQLWRRVGCRRTEQGTPLGTHTTTVPARGKARPIPSPQLSS